MNFRGFFTKLQIKYPHLLPFSFSNLQIPLNLLRLANLLFLHRFSTTLFAFKFRNLRFFVILFFAPFFCHIQSIILFPVVNNNLDRIFVPQVGSHSFGRIDRAMLTTCTTKVHRQVNKPALKVFFNRLFND